jgi:hypothetical protein
MCNAARKLYTFLQSFEVVCTLFICNMFLSYATFKQKIDLVCLALLSHSACLQLLFAHSTAKFLAVFEMWYANLGLGEFQSPGQKLKTKRNRPINGKSTVVKLLTLVFVLINYSFRIIWGIEVLIKYSN